MFLSLTSISWLPIEEGLKVWIFLLQCIFALFLADTLFIVRFRYYVFQKRSPRSLIDTLVTEYALLALCNDLSI